MHFILDSDTNWSKTIGPLIPLQVDSSQRGVDSFSGFYQNIILLHQPPAPNHKHPDKKH